MIWERVDGCDVGNSGVDPVFAFCTASEKLNRGDPCFFILIEEGGKSRMLYAAKARRFAMAGLGEP